MERAITSSASPRAIVILTGLLKLKSCTLRDDDVAEWRMQHGIVVTCTIGDNAAHWHLSHEDDRDHSEEA